MHSTLLATLGFILLLMTSGCLSPITLERTLVSYDKALTQSLKQQLLLNVVRAHNRHPIHFTGVANIASTYDFRINVGATPPLGGLEGGFALAPFFGGTVSENPTISIVPIEGEDFTNRLLTPMRESKLTLLLRQGVDIDLLLRLMAREFRMSKGLQDVVYHNRPSHQQNYTVFRQIVLHLSTLQDRNLLYVEPFTFEKIWEVPFTSLSGEDFKDLEEVYEISVAPNGKSYTLKKRVNGQVIITNYDPKILSNEERRQLNAEAERWPPNDLLVDIRPNFSGGEYPFKGKFRLGSFHAILNFLGRGIEVEPEYHVDKDSRTPPITENPIRTLTVKEATAAPEEAVIAVHYKDHYYYIPPEEDMSWNREAFRVLYQLFQMTVTEVPRTGAPSITIAK